MENTKQLNAMVNNLEDRAAKNCHLMSPFERKSLSYQHIDLKIKLKTLENQEAIKDVLETHLQEIRDKIILL